MGYSRISFSHLLCKRAFAIITIAGLIAVLLAAALGGSPPRALAAFPAPQGKVTFESNQDGAWQVFTINADGSGQANITNGVKYVKWPTSNANNFAAAWSADGTRVAFISDRDYDGNGSVDFEIYIMNADGTGLKRLTYGGVGLSGNRPTWSPDGTKIAFTLQRSNSSGQISSEINVMNLDGTALTNLTQGQAADSQPNWSPDGTRIVFSSDPGNEDHGIYVMNVDGSNRTRLSPGVDPDWSPDGSQIVFSGYGGYGGICVINNNGSGLRQLSSNGYNPAWSPDGFKIAFERFRLDTGAAMGDGAEIYLMNVDGSGLVKLTNNSADNRTNEWQPLPDHEDDTTPPTVSNVEPTGTIDTTNTTISADYADAQSGVNSVSVAVYLDNQRLENCTATDTHVNCDVTGLAEGKHIIGGSVADAAGNSSPISGEFEVSPLAPIMDLVPWPITNLL